LLYPKITFRIGQGHATPQRVLNPGLQDQYQDLNYSVTGTRKVNLINTLNFGVSISWILFWKLEYWSPWWAREFYGQSSSFVPGVVKWIKYTFCIGRVLLLPLPGNTGSLEACKHFEFGVIPQIARFRRLWALWLIGKLGSPAIIGPKDGFCSGQITPSERC